MINENLNLTIRDDLSPRYLLVASSDESTRLLYEGDSVGDAMNALYEYRNEKFIELDELKLVVKDEVDNYLYLLKSKI